MKKNPISLPVRIAASVVLVPKAIASIPSGIKGSAKAFVTKVDNEIDRRESEVLKVMTD